VNITPVLSYRVQSLRNFLIRLNGRSTMFLYVSLSYPHGSVLFDFGGISARVRRPPRPSTGFGMPSEKSHAETRSGKEKYRRTLNARL